MKLKIAVCDDEKKQREYVTELVSDWARKNRHLTEIRQYEHAKSFLFDYETEKDFDILLLDIEMPEINGIELAKKVRLENSAVQIIFITGFYEYFSDGFDVSALHYLIKPVDAGKLYPVLEKAVSNLTYRQRSVLVSTAEGDIKVPLAEILYVESENTHVVVHCLQESYRMRITLGKFAHELDETFFKVHRSYIVGLKYIRKITRSEVVMINGDLIPISRGMYEEVHTALIRHL